MFPYTENYQKSFEKTPHIFLTEPNSIVFRKIRRSGRVWADNIIRLPTDIGVLLALFQN